MVKYFAVCMDHNSLLNSLMAAVTAARNGRNVILLEHMDQAGKKLLATGSGKCNYTNLELAPEFYFCEDKTFIRTVLEQFSCPDMIRFFEDRE